MLTRYCPNCGTEVDETAIFCPTCGQPIDEAAETQMPAAPAWPEAPPRDERAESPRAVEPAAPTMPIPAVAADPVPEPPEPVEPDSAVEPQPRSDVAPAWRADEAPALDRSAPVERAAPAAPPPVEPAAPPAATLEARSADREGRRQAPSSSVRITTPVTLSGWLIGGGAVVAIIGALIGLTRGFVNPVEFLMLLALLGIAASVFAAASLPAFAHLRLVTLAVALIGFGMGLDRIGFGRANAGDLLFFLGTAAAAIGAVLVELGQDQPLGGPRA